MKEKMITDPDNEYYIISLKHTNKKDKYVTLWRPNNAGYCYSLCNAGVYNGYENGYHLSEGNKPIRIEDVPKSFIILDDHGERCIKVSKASINFIIEYKP